MDSFFTSGAVIGKKSDGRWGQVIKTPYAYGVLEVEDEGGMAQLIGMERIHVLAKILSEPITSMRDIVTAVDALDQVHLETLILCVPIQHTVTIILRGTGVVYLRRDGHMSRLRSTEGTVSGAVKKGDVLFLSSKSCLIGVSEEELFQFFDHMAVEDSAEKLTLYLHKNSSAVGYAGLFLGIDGSGMVHEDGRHDVPAPVRQKQFSRTRHFALAHRVQSAGVRLRELWKNMDMRITSGVLILFLLCVFIGLYREISMRKMNEGAKAIIEIERLYEEGSALLDLNPIKSRERLTQAKQKLDEAKKTVSPRSREGRELSDLEKKIGEALPKATKDFETTPELFYDVSFLKNGSTITAFGMYGDTMALLDANNRTVYQLQLTNKNGQIVGGGGGFDGSSLVSTHGNVVYVFTGGGVNAIRTEDKSVKAQVIKKSDAWGTIRSMVSFGGNLYLMDTGKSRIWKYIATESAFLDTKEYLNPDYFPDLSRATDMAIDGSVWVGTSTGSVLRFTQGKEDAFVPSGVEPQLGNNTYVFTDDNCENVYILDPDNRRVVVLEKDGIYKAQYRYTPPFAPTMIAVSEKLRLLFFFSDGKLYTTALK